jgi:hypothetical protein
MLMEAAPRPLPKRFVMYLPEVEAGRTGLLEAVEHLFCRRFGGVTSYPAVGLFQSESGAIQRERVQVLECYGELENWSADCALLRGLATVIASLLDQEAIACSVDGRMHLVAPAGTDLEMQELATSDLKTVVDHLVQAARSVRLESTETW